MFTLESYFKEIVKANSRILKEADTIRIKKKDLADPICNQTKKHYFQSSSQIKQLSDFIKDKEIPFIESIEEEIIKLIKKKKRIIKLIKKQNKTQLLADVEWLWQFFKEISKEIQQILTHVAKERRYLDKNEFKDFLNEYNIEQRTYARIDGIIEKYHGVGNDIYKKTGDKVILKLLKMTGTTFKKATAIVMLALLINFTPSFVNPPAYAFDIYGAIAQVLGFKSPIRELVEKTVNETMKKLAPSINKYSSELGIDARIVGGVIYVEMFRNLTTPKGFIETKLEGNWFTRELLSLKGATFGIGQMACMEMGGCRRHFKSPKSPFYMGKKFENYITQEDFIKANEGTPYVTESGVNGYKYTNPDAQIKFVAAMIAQIQSHWKNAGYDISSKPEILGTLYNLGFEKSKPKAHPKSGGTENYIFGENMRFGDAVKAWHDSALNQEIKGYKIHENLK